MSKKRYEQLLEGFRDEWCKHRDVPFNIEIIAPSSFSRENPPYDRERYELLAQVSLPYDATRKITPDFNNSTLFGWAIVKKDDRTTEARESFRRLCDQAGAALPSQFREHLSGLCNWHMAEPATWWIALLVFLSGQSAYARNGSYQGHVLLLRPFLLCVDAIEQCRLNTDNPEFPERIGVCSSGDDGTEGRDDETNPDPESQPPADKSADAKGGDGDDQAYRELAEWAAEELKGKQRRVVDLLVGNNGMMPIPDLKLACEWEGDEFGRCKQHVNNKLHKIGWIVERHDNEARLRQVKGRQK